MFSSGLCSYHYEENRRRHMPICAASGCSERSSKKGLCEKHYREQRRTEVAPCSVTGCGRPTVASGLCGTHYKRIQRYGTLEVDNRAHDRGLREKHPLYQRWAWHRKVHTLSDAWMADFWAMVDCVGEQPSPNHRLYRPDETEPIGPDNWEWRESIPLESRNKYQREWHRRNPERSKSFNLMRKYGIDYAEYERMLDAQNGVCAICNRAETARDSANPLTVKRLAVDHCHTTKKVRGLLCASCNTSIHMIERDPAIIERVVKYLGLKKDSD
jgi:hypothetical protein